MKRIKLSYALGIVLPLIACLHMPMQGAQAAQIQGIAPEVAASVWQEDDQEVASVCLNGRELISFRAPKDSGQAQTKAEDLAAKLQDMLDDKKFDANDLLPGRAGATAFIQSQGANVLSFDTQGGVLSSESDESTSGEPHVQPLRLSWQFVNELRTAFGAPTLPQDFLKLAISTGQDLSSKLVSCFSGTASWYGPHFHGRKTSDGHRFDMNKMTAAHKTLPFGTKLLVMNRNTGQSCVVEVNDRGPFVGNRVLDLSRGAASQVGMLSTGVAPVACLVLSSSSN